MAGPSNTRKLDVKYNDIKAIQGLVLTDQLPSIEPQPVNVAASTTVKTYDDGTKLEPGQYRSRKSDPNSDILHGQIVTFSNDGNVTFTSLEKLKADGIVVEGKGNDQSAYLYEEFGFDSESKKFYV